MPALPEPFQLDDVVGRQAFLGVDRVLEPHIIVDDGLELPVDPRVGVGLGPVRFEAGLQKFSRASPPGTRSKAPASGTSASRRRSRSAARLIPIISTSRVASRPRVMP